MYLTVFTAYYFDGPDAPKAFHRHLRGPLQRSAAATPESALCKLFLSSQREEPGPVAAVTLLHDTGIRTSRWCLRADPVYLHPRRHELILISGFGDHCDANARLSDDEVERLAREIEDVVNIHGGELRPSISGRWYLLFDRQSRVITTPPGVVLGEDVSCHLPRGPDAMHWRMITNELQMRLHECAVNTARERAGRYPVNSLWLWGGGCLPQAVNGSRWTRVVCEDDELVCGLAATCGIEMRCAYGLDLDAIGREGRVLWVAGRGPRWTTTLDADSRVQLLAALRRGDIERLTIVDAANGTYALAARDMSLVGRIGRFLRPARNEHE